MIVVLQYSSYDRTVITIVNYDRTTFIVQAKGVTVTKLFFNLFTDK